MSRQRTALAYTVGSMNNKPNQSVWKGTGDEATQDNALVRVLNLGLDLHYRQVTVAMQEDGGRIKAAGKMGYELFLNWIQKKLEEGWQINSCYEAGASGYWLHRLLEPLGVRNLVVVPKVMDPGGKKQKTDKRGISMNRQFRKPAAGQCWEKQGKTVFCG
jgi:hypothetical protein